MAGFGSVTLVGEYFGQEVVNKLWYRSSEWLPLQGNPFDDVLAFVDAVLLEVQASFLDCLPANYTLLRAEGVGYSDTFSVVTPSPLVRTVGVAGGNAGDTTGAIICANIGLRCGAQVQINGLVQSKRNRGYVAIGPLLEAWTDNYGHLAGAGPAQLDDLAQRLDDSITLITPAVTLIPIRIHEVWQRVPNPLPDILLGRTYSDVLGYTLPRKFGTRKSRMTEA